ncbi:hypothetical protein [Rhodoplanes azumiensis]|uniref:Uncharacterized protein n=1 Tax=Rhodoplanes azumiensis TaxID=1897628 RepID=A0ABW5AEP5_9BRAD
MPLDSFLAADIARLRIAHDALVVEVKLLRLRLRLDRARQSELKTACDRAFARCMTALRRYAETCRKANYDENQPCVPAGNPDGGQWTSEGGGGEALARQDELEILSDVTPDNDWTPGARYAQSNTTSGSRSNAGQGLTGSVRLAARRFSPAREAECEAQYKQDVFHCRMVGLSTCYAQASLRYANCLQGLPIPPLNY